MNKRKEANIRVKRDITVALFALMKQKSLAEVTITELVERAGVARASFYRNYCSKEDVLITLIRDVLEAFRQESDLSQGIYTYENILLSFQYFQRYRSYVLDLYACGFASALLEELNRFHEGVEGTMPSTSIEKYQLYVYIGSLFNAAIVWLTEDCKAAPEELARYFYAEVFRFLPGPPALPL